MLFEVLLLKLVSRKYDSVTVRPFYKTKTSHIDEEEIAVRNLNFYQPFLLFSLYNHKMTKLKQEQFLPITLEQAWDFFATPKNLNEVTPTDLVFEIISELPDKMYEGLIITYRIKPMLNIAITWCTEITHIQDHEFFVDEQRKGPYNIWHHEHHFREVPGGVLMTDILHYDIGKSIFGWIAGKLFVHKKVNEIFQFRYKTLETYFATKNKTKPVLA